MYEHVAQGESTPKELTPTAEKILLEAAQACLLSHPEPGTIQEVPSDDGQFKREVRALWGQRSGSDDPGLFEDDFAALEERIRIVGAEELILQERAKRAEARQALLAQSEALLPTVSPEAADPTTSIKKVRRFGGGTLGKLIRRQ